jgi:Fic family protein
MKKEHTALMEAMLPKEGNITLGDLVLDLVQKTSELTTSLNPAVTKEVSLLVRSMNCYYSNLIEGHNTTPREIDQALSGNYSTEPEKRALQLEAKAHIEVQGMIDSGLAPQVSPTSKEYLLWLHYEFCSRLPEELLILTNPDTGREIQVVPGQLRDGEVSVGRHIPPLQGNLDSFLTRFEEAYVPERLSKVSQVISAAAAHHRLTWIHPFYDGNGRVVRLMSYVMLARTGAGSPLWSVARGLARETDRYKSLLEAADMPRQGDRDGRGSLSEKALVNFCQFFLEVCIDQVKYMKDILNSSELERRMRLYVEDEIAAKRLLKGSDKLLREALLIGEFERHKAQDITGYSDRQARRVLSSLLKANLLKSDTPKGPVRLGFPINVLERWFPLLYPQV